MNLPDLLDLLALFGLSALMVIALIALSNTRFFLRLGHAKPADADTQPMVSVMIPARNEAHIILTTVMKLDLQDYPNYEIIVLDDSSTDGTSDMIEDYPSARVTLITGKPLPPGWLGKNWACHQMAQVAKGDIFIFTDADVQWHYGSLDCVVNDMQATRADLLTVWPTQITVTWAERLIVPLMALVVNSYLPLWGTHHVPLSLFAAANGQCMAWQRDAYFLTGGHEAVRDNVLEDVTLARMAKAKGLRLRMEDGAGWITCRMYDGWREVRDGFAKNIIAGYGNSVVALLVATVFHWLLFIFPWGLLAYGLSQPGSADSERWVSWAWMMIGLGLGVRALTAAMTRQRVLDALLMPVSALLMTLIAARAIYWRITGRTSWKGRTLAKASKAP